MLMPSVALAQAVRQQPSKKIALVVGVQNYDDASSLTKLRTPISDAVSMAAKLEAMGFKATLLRDPNTRELLAALADFSDRVRSADTAVVYYAGHGIQATQEGSVATKFFAPTDFRPPGGGATGKDLELAFKAAMERSEIVGLSMVQRSIRTAEKVGVVFWDACRSNPFYDRPVALPSDRERDEAQRPRQGQLTRAASPFANRPAAGPLPPLTNPQPIKIKGPRGIIVQSATQPGRDADDGNGNHSPYTTALLKHVGTPGLTIDAMLRAVATEVNQATGGRQMPQVESDLVGGDVALVPPERGNSTTASGSSSQPSTAPRSGATQRASGGRSTNGVDCVGQGCRSTATFSDGKKVTIETMGVSPLE